MHDYQIIEIFYQKNQKKIWGIKNKALIFASAFTSSCSKKVLIL
jgi:hypothetical protein